MSHAAICAIIRFVLAILLAGPLITASWGGAGAAAPDNIPLPKRKPQAPAVIPDRWSEKEIEIAQNRCAKLLSKLPIHYERLDPIKKGVCGSPIPLKVTALGRDTERVEIKPPAKLNCDMAAMLAVWLDNHVQPQAKKLLKTKIVAIHNIASYSCRRRYGNPKKPYSEHAFMNALDIAAFRTKSGENITLLKNWGVTRRTLRKREKEERKRRAQEYAEKIAQHQATEKRQKLEQTNAKKLSRKADKLSGPREELDNKSGGPLKLDPAILTEAAKWAATIQFEPRTQAEKDQEKHPSRIFLRKVFAGACELFGTVLSPEANRAHENHFHLDMAPRRRSGYCE